MESWKRSELAGYGSYGIVVGTVAILLLLPVGGTLASTTSQPREIPTGTSDTTSYTPSTWAFAQYSERGVSSLGQPPSSRNSLGTSALSSSDALDCTGSGRPCYYAGFYYDAASQQVTSVSMTMATPNDSAVNGDVYYLLLSIWDSANSYDQIGITTTYGHWQVFYSAGENCFNGPIYWSNQSYGLAQNTQWTFQIFVSPGGYVEFIVYSGTSSAIVWSTSIHTGASYLEVSSSPPSACSGFNYGYEDYEEVWTLVQQDFPTWSFSFDNNRAGVNLGNSQPVSYWNELPYPPYDIGYSIAYGNNLNVLNEPYGLQMSFCGFNQNFCSITISWGKSATVYGTVTQLRTGVLYIQSMSTYLSPSGYTFSFNPSSNFQIPATFSLTINTPASGCNSGFVGVKASMAGNPYGGPSFSTFRFQVVISNCPTHCVAWGTPILTPNGYVPVQDIRPGDTVEEYNLTSSTMVTGILVAGNTSSVSQLVDINNGWLYVTLTDQPIYISNSTFVGWLHDPQNLTIGDSIFDPVSQSWVQVTSVHLVSHRAKVIDVVTDGVHDFIAAGALLLDKQA